MMTTLNHSDLCYMSSKVIRKEVLCVGTYDDDLV
jgi:hypothetical protein